jgi:uncharacterized protein DUF3800
MTAVSQAHVTDATMNDSLLEVPPSKPYTHIRTLTLWRELHFRGPRVSVGLRASGAAPSFYVAYLREFGHIGQYVCRRDENYNASPLFGLGGIVLPAQSATRFATYFEHLKRNLLAYEIRRAGVPADQFEKKGAALYTKQNVVKYPQLRRATFRLLNRVAREGGKVFHLAVEKTLTPDRHSPQRLYEVVLADALAHLDRFCLAREALFTMVLDVHSEGSFRDRVVSEAARAMSESARGKRGLPPPVRIDSQLFASLQCADWICSLVGKLCCYDVAPLEFPELAWIEKYFGARLEAASGLGCIRRGLHARTIQPVHGAT